MKRLIQLTIIIAILAILAIQTGAVPPADFPDVCLSAENIMPNCNFDNGMAGWVPFLESGAANVGIQQGGGECHAPLCPAVHITTEGNFTGGIYQQVPVAAGNSYYANIVWLAFDSINNDPAINSAVGGIGRRIGIDPTGGTDSRSGNVVWSEDNWRNDCKICNVEHVTVTAQADTITVFVRIDDNWRQRAAENGYDVPYSKDQFWLDDIGMKQVAGDAVAAAQPPTETPAPPTDTPAPAAPTETPIPPTDTPEPTEEPTTPPTEEPTTKTVATATATTVIAAAPPTLTPSPTPTETPTLPPRPTRTPTPPPAPASANSNFDSPLSAGVLGTVGATACVGGIFLLVMAAVITGVIWLYRLGWGQKDNEYEAYDGESDDEAPDEIVIEIDEDEEEE